MINKLLIANRGEIAVRIIRACREMGIKTVAVYSQADADSLHTQLADESICIGKAAATDSYLNMERILSATIASGADAIHPGFGFLSENSKFVGLCEKCNITFVGPSSDIIAKMGNKSEARNTMKKAGIPIIEGTDEPLFEAHLAKKFADDIGYPVMIKAALGGGGKGMRVVYNAEDFIANFNSAQQETIKGFGDNSMYIEKYIEHPRHVEFQILADNYGNVIHLGERDCSVQRRHQKMIEESPSDAIDEKLRKKMGETAIKAAKAVGYTNAGTVEFLLDKNNNFYFIEINTRIQVEHGVTELVTGLDLIKEQIKIASGEKLNYTQSDIKLRGHAMEVRINAENPERNFAPCPGTIKTLHIPGGNGVRIDTAVYTGYSIPPYYDSMILKVMAYDTDREQVINKLKSVLGEIIIEGIDTNLDFQYDILNNKNFAGGKITTDFIKDNYGY
ncbi:acetyl-CoA carboxylase biotin carboxylase subunit [Falcatimonas sp. MSJ-15]|uniref:acetyl-CoA carboxylase biotin carboxylase subunit n=1 Tax=Falcatimonas sp. MSJ-15 TaxID=2841515 RepID=UPI001C0F5527|nr:acetyl-CoA carboxylase biotin carboxylase subunit [Falcatimonas sp. MSJ-15]MBU5469707.1 acetyl-CoA carboxylase biotin carboxylase subunit [Falcatimonas sp. MSJ-15]